MSIVARTVIVTIISVFVGLSDSPRADARPYSLTRCGPNLAYLCRLHGYFDSQPFHYNLALYPGCFRTVTVRTHLGRERRRELICGTQDRPQIRW